MIPSATTPPRLVTLVLLTILSTASLNLIVPSLAHIAEDFAITYAEASLAISLFMAITAVLQVLVGPLSDLFGRRPVLLVSMAIFIIATIGCAFAESFKVFMIFRVLQAAIITNNVLGRAIVRDTSEPQAAASVLGTIGMALALGPMLAPLVGGTLDQLFGWRSTFHFLTLTGLALMVLAWADVGETNASRGGDVMAQVRGYPRLLADPIFWSYTLCMALSMATYFAFLTGMPLIADAQFGLTGALLGLALGLPPVGFLLGNWISARTGHRLPGPVIMVAGRVITAAAMFCALALWLAGFRSPTAFLLFMPLIGLGNGLTFPAGNVGAMSVRPELAGSAAGLSGACMVAGAAVMTAITGQMLTQHGKPLTLLLLLNGAALLALLAGLPALRAHVARTTPACP